jgi:putative GTP pyrophosphokinase
MPQPQGPGFPGGSKSRVNRAGQAVREQRARYPDYLVIEDWRAAHRVVLNTFQANLRLRTRGAPVKVAQRHKRRRTIFDKLQRYPGMQLARMDDVAGCRLIFPSIEELYSFRQDWHCARFRHRLRNDVDKYDYIKSPKPTGYRGVHDVYSYDVNSRQGRHLKGLLIEIQYRTLVQHAWATAVEVIGFITESQPKFEQGDTRYQLAMSYASEILARRHESRFGPFPDLSNGEVVRRFLTIDSEIHLLRTLRGLDSVQHQGDHKRNAILIFSPEGELEVKHFRTAPDALRALFELERQRPSHDIVLVRADSDEEVRLAFRNYFSDASDFLTLIDDGLVALR